MQYDELPICPSCKQMPITFVEIIDSRNTTLYGVGCITPHCSNVVKIGKAYYRKIEEAHSHWCKWCKTFQQINSKKLNKKENHE